MKSRKKETGKKSSMKTSSNKKSSTKKSSTKKSSNIELKFSNLYTFKNNLHYHIINYQNKNDNTILNNLDSYNIYTYNELKMIEDDYKKKSKIEKTILDKKVNDDDKKIIKQVSEGYARGVSKYVLINYNLPRKTSNGYMKLWEMYMSIPQLIQNKKKQINVFHLAEAPGQWINCTTHFINTKRHNIKKYNWLANSLNHKNPENMKKYGKGVFGDDYGFIKKNPQKWLYGKDNTGDITKSENIRWFRNYMKKIEPLNLITGDGGMGGSNLVELQKIDYAQVCMVASCASIGTNCIIKHFHHMNNKLPASQKGSGFIVGFLYIYYLMFEDIRLIKPHTSSPNSGEFYVVGLKFKGLKEDIIDKLLLQLDNFQENNCFFNKADIKEEFVIQILDFIHTLINKHITQQKFIKLFLDEFIDKTKTKTKTKTKNPNTIIGKYLDTNFIKQIQSKRYKEWIKTFKFE